MRERKGEQQTVAQGAGLVDSLLEPAGKVGSGHCARRDYDAPVEVADVVDGQILHRSAKRRSAASLSFRIFSTAYLVDIGVPRGTRRPSALVLLSLMSPGALCARSVMPLTFADCLSPCPAVSARVP